MMPICFNVSVYQMDDKGQMVEESTNSTVDNGLQDDAIKSIDTSCVELEVVGNLLSSTFTYVDTEAIQTIQACKSIEDFNISVEENIDYDFSRTREFPDVPFDRASSKENQTEDFCPSNIHDEETTIPTSMQKIPT